jgi:hypothetical protein
MKAIIALCLVLMCLSAQARWLNSNLTDESKSVKGFIIHTHAVGSDSLTPAVVIKSSLQLSCLNRGTAREQKPMISIRWPKENGKYKPGSMEIKLDGARYTLTNSEDWVHHNTLVYRSVSSAAALIDAMASSKQIEFTWQAQDDSKKRVIFDLSEFSTNLRVFNQNC